MKVLVVGRFAPSPSGRMHLGNLFTALIAWLSVRAQGGKMLLRIEDLDPERSKPEFIAALREDLLWLGLDWEEEMPLQSTQTERYAAAFARLDTYPCYCTRNALHDASAPHVSDGTYVYPGICRNLTAEERAAFSRSPSWRVRVPAITVDFSDGVFGDYRQNLAKECGDFIVRRSDGVYAYQLAVVCDDAFGGVTEVVRGSDLLDSTPRQIWLYQTLGFPVPKFYQRQIWLYQTLGFSMPKFYHVPLLVAPDGKRLSKREKSLDMEQLRKRFRPEELLGRLACAAGLRETAEPISARELTTFFDWKKIGKAPIPISPDF